MRAPGSIVTCFKHFFDTFMVLTRSQARREQSSGLAAPQGVNSPLRRSSPLQIASTSSGPVAGSNGLGGTQVPVAGGYYVEWRRGGRGAKVVPKFPQKQNVLKEQKTKCQIAPK